MLRFVNDHDRVGAADVAPLGTGAEVSAEKRPRVFGVGVMRALLVVVYLLLAWPLVLPDSAAFPSDIPEGIAIAALTLAVVAGINLGPAGFVPIYRLTRVLHRATRSEPYRYGFWYQIG